MADLSKRADQNSAAKHYLIHLFSPIKRSVQASQVDLPPPKETQSVAIRPAEARPPEPPTDGASERQWADACVEDSARTRRMLAYYVCAGFVGRPCIHCCSNH